MKLQVYNSFWKSWTTNFLASYNYYIFIARANYIYQILVFIY